MQPVGRITLRLLGRFTLQVEGNPATSIRISSKKGCGLIAYLAMHAKEGESREALATLLWGNQHDRQARQNLRQCLTSLRADLALMAPDLLVFEGDTVGLDLSALTVDVREFMALTESSATDELVRAAGLYRGEFLAGFSFDVEPFDEWVRAERGRIAAAAAKVHEFCISHFDRLGNGSRVIEAAERLTELDPLREDWQRLLLRAYARYRGPDAALTHANTLTALLKRELGVEPDGATSDLLTEIRRGAIAPAVGARPFEAKESAAKAGVTAERSESAPAATPQRVRRVLAGVAPAASRKQLVITILGVVAALVGGLLFASQLAMLPGQNSNSWAPPKPPPGLASNVAALRAHAIVPIIVWPFDAPEGGNDRKFADAITRNLINVLSQNDGLRVISRDTSYYYREHLADPAAIGARLGVTYVVEGSVRTRNARVHVDVQLIDTATSLQVWGDQFERDDIDSFKVQSEIANRLARELRVEAMISDVHHGRKKSEPALSELVARARAAHFRGPSKANISASLEYFEKALQRDPNLVPALVGIASELTMGGLNYVLDPEPSLKRAEKLLVRAQTIRPNSASTNYWMGMVRKGLGQYDSALKSFQLAIETGPSFAPAYAQAGITLTLMGRADDAMHYIEYAIRLSPKDRAMRYWTLFAGATQFERGNDKAALEWLNKSAAYAPQSPSVHIYLAAIYALTGNKMAAAKHAAEFRSLANSAATADLMEQIRLGSQGKYANMRRLRSGLEVSFSASL
jgi:DNA-binding SARP family transcriptional activator/TolB-like protein/Tfp pilus assembly protein PilF